MIRKKKTMPPLTVSMRELIDGYIASHPAFRDALMQEAIESMLGGDVETGKTILGDYIKATQGFEELGRAIGTPSKSLIRMFGPRGNPRRATCSALSVTLHVEARRARVAGDQRTEATSGAAGGLIRPRPQAATLRGGPMEPNDSASATWNRKGRSLVMIKIKPPAKTENDPKQAAENESIKHIAENAVHGGPKDVKKDKRSGAGRGQKG